MPEGKPGEGSRESLTIGMRAWGRGLTWNLVSEIQNEGLRLGQERRGTDPVRGGPRARRQGQMRKGARQNR